jgi:Uma2 family endonuclease
VSSPSTATYDREIKLPLYALHGVRWVWLVDPLAQRLEVRVLGEHGRWGTAVTFEGAARVRAVPFDAIELDLAVLWAR